MSESGATEREPDPTSERRGHRAESSEPDVLLDIPEVTVDQLRLAVDGLDADLSLRARLANLLELDAGVRVHLTGVELDVTGVSAEALFEVRLERLVRILDRALATIDGNPQLVDALARTVGAGMADVNRAAGQPTGGEGAPVAAEGGQRIGAVGVAGGRTPRERVAKPAPPSPTAGTRHPEPPIGPGGQQPPGPSAEAVWPEAAGAPPPGERRGQPGRATGGQPGRAAGGQPSRAAGPGQPESGGGQGGRPVGPFGAVHLAGEAGETLRQVGRSVWEAIQAGMGQQRQQPPER